MLRQTKASTSEKTASAAMRNSPHPAVFQHAGKLNITFYYLRLLAASITRQLFDINTHIAHNISIS
jgi:hypothetical protein